LAGRLAGGSRPISKPLTLRWMTISGVRPPLLAIRWWWARMVKTLIKPPSLMVRIQSMISAVLIIAVRSIFIKERIPAGLSRPISKPLTLGRVTISGIQPPLLAIRWWWARIMKALGQPPSLMVRIQSMISTGLVPPKKKLTAPSWKSLFNSYSRIWGINFTTVLDIKGRQIFIFNILD
jgi:hypothetical protein